MGLGGTGLESQTIAVVALFQVGAVRPAFELTCSPTLSSGSVGVGVWVNRARSQRVPVLLRV